MKTENNFFKKNMQYKTLNCKRKVKMALFSNVVMIAQTKNFSMGF